MAQRTAMNEFVDPRDLSVGDVIELPIGTAEVIAAPELGQTGSSIFDVHELYWLVGVRLLADEERTGYATFPTSGGVRLYAASLREAATEERPPSDRDHG